MMRNLTLHQRVVFLVSGSIILLGVVFVIFINVLSPLFIINEISSPDTMLMETIIDEEGNAITILQVTPAPEGYTIAKMLSMPDSHPLTVISVLSIVGLAAITIIGFFISKMVAKYSLLPLTEISGMAKEIDSRSLNQRINFQGPQDEVKFLGDTIDSMFERLEKNFEQQNHFISNLAHELRTPLTSMRMNIEAIKEDPDAVLSDFRSLLINEEQALLHLERLIRDLLLLAKGEKELSIQPIIFEVMIEAVLDELYPIAQDNHISFQSGGSIGDVIHGDPDLLQRVFTNLIENGIHYNRSGGYVDISAKTKDDWIIIEVRDNGIGISQENIGKIFNRFCRIKGEPQFSGHNQGLGLAIARHIVDLHHGKIEVESEEGKGSTFRVRLPRRLEESSSSI